ncbi:hypothetical protein ACPPVU_22300 [Mucilaginibacter sp. McL0603]|uniref:hypothetical protein n=1 Tax=Mucilaginibacter sp. McL0603 TaxID=3415670 RepID=UPI003CF116B4
MKQTVLTIITEIDPKKIEQLKGILVEIQGDLYNNRYLPFSKISLVHFASFVIVDQTGSPSLLVFENNFDGDLSDYLDQLLSVAGVGVDQLYQCCIGYQAAELKSFLTSHVIPPNAYHIGNVGRAAKDVANNRELRKKLQDYLDQLFNLSKPANLSETQLRKNIQAFAKSDIASDLSAELPPHQTLSERVIPWVRLIILGLVLVVLAVGLFPVTIALILILRHKEKTDQPKKDPASLSHVDALMTTENQIAQNHLASITDIKPGKFRLYTLKFVLFAVNTVARIANKGKLSGIPSIHFAHWSIINNKQLLFLSNFDGSWSSYLDDFIDKASPGLTGVWTNAVGFPETRFLILDGARDELRFKAFARNMQIPSLVWYSAYPDLTVQNIDKDSAIREDMWTDLSETDTKTWLKHF